MQQLSFQGRVWALLPRVHSPAAAAAWTCCGENDSEIWKVALVISLLDQRQLKSPLGWAWLLGELTDEVRMIWMLVLWDSGVC